MRRFTKVEGFCYASTFYEDVSGSRAAFEELTNELKRAEARHVVVPSLEHLSSHPLLRNHMIERLELDADAHVLTPDGS